MHYRPDESSSSGTERYITLATREALAKLSFTQIAKLLLQVQRGDSRTSLKKFLHSWIGISNATILDDALAFAYSHKEIGKIWAAREALIKEESEVLQLFSRTGGCRRSCDIPWLFSVSDENGCDYVTHTFFPRCIARIDAGEITELWFIDDCNDATRGAMPHRILKAWTRFEENGYSDDADNAEAEEESEVEEVEEGGDTVNETTEENERVAAETYAQYCRRRELETEVKQIKASAVTLPQNLKDYQRTRDGMPRRLREGEGMLL